MSDGMFQDAIALLQEGRNDDGVNLLRQVAASGHPRALFVLADLTWAGNLVEADPVRGRLLFEYAASLGDAQANILATNLLASGIAGKRDWRAALQRLEAEASQLPDRRRMLELLEAMALDSNGEPTSIAEPEQLSEQPFSRLFRRLVSPAECTYLIALSDERFEPSSIYDGQGKLIRDPIRTSDGAAVHWLIEDPVIHAINRRIARATDTEYDRGEPLQVLRYSPGQEYRPHFDYLEGADNPRPWTALVYLNEDFEGGATCFVRTGLEVRGRTGDVLVFRNPDERGQRDPFAEHAGMPVTSGTKYLATRWIRQRRFTP